MSLYSGTVSVRLEGDKQRALALVPDAKALLAKVQSLTSNSGASTFAMSQRLDSGTYLYALVSYGLNIVRISADPVVPDSVETPEELPVERRLALDFYSGLVFEGLIVTQDIIDTDGNEVEVLACESFAPTAVCRDIQTDLEPGKQIVPRLAVTAWPGLGFEGADTQYAYLKPSMYSGLMVRVVQVLMGYGRLRKEQIVDSTIYPTKESIPEYLNAVVGRGVQVRYDYKFHRTHGIVKGSDQRLWLVEISITRGVLAMPLPYFTSLPDPEDNAAFLVIEQLGGLPSGESFPLDASDSIAAGDILQLMSSEELEGVYSCTPYSTALGWAFNERGNEAHATGYFFREEDGIQIGLHWQLSFVIGPVNEDRVPGQPIATGSAALSEQGRGYLWADYSEFGRYLPFKVYEPLLPGLLSHDGSPRDPIDEVPLCNTTMFAAFQGNDIVLAKFFYDPRLIPNTGETDDREDGECLYAGEWTWTSTTGNRYVNKAMYTNLIDDRMALDEAVTSTTLTSTDLGFDPPRYTDFLQNIQWCIVFRQRVFRETEVSNSYSGEFAKTMFVSPYGDRSAFYYTFGHGYASYIRGTLIRYRKLLDPNVYYGWRNVPGSGDPVPGHCESDECGGRHINRRIVCYSFEPFPCSEFADYGEWAQLCDDVLAITSTAPIRNGSSSTEDLGNNFSGSLTFSSPTTNGFIGLSMTYSQFQTWQLPSPHPISGAIQHIHAQHAALGEPAAVYDSQLRGQLSQQRTFGTVPEVINDADEVTFIGVNGHG